MEFLASWVKPIVSLVLNIIRGIAVWVAYLRGRSSVLNEHKDNVIAIRDRQTKAAIQRRGLGASIKRLLDKDKEF